MVSWKKDSYLRAMQKYNIYTIGPFCHGALKPDIHVSTLFTTFFLWTSLQFILPTFSKFKHIKAVFQYSSTRKTDLFL